MSATAQTRDPFSLVVAFEGSPELLVNTFADLGSAAEAKMQALDDGALQAVILERVAT